MAENDLQPRVLAVYYRPYYKLYMLMLVAMRQNFLITVVIAVALSIFNLTYFSLNMNQRKKLNLSCLNVSKNKAEKLLTCKQKKIICCLVSHTRVEKEFISQRIVYSFLQ